MILELASIFTNVPKYHYNLCSIMDTAAQKTVPS